MNTNGIILHVALRRSNDAAPAPMPSVPFRWLVAEFEAAFAMLWPLAALALVTVAAWFFAMAF